MVREHKRPNEEPVKTVMNMPLTVEDTRAIMKQVNAIWAPARIQWVTDPAKGGGGIITEKAGGGRLSKANLKKLADAVVARKRGSLVNSMQLVFPKLTDPANNEMISGNGEFNRTKAEMYHFYLYPYVGQTLQGTAFTPGTFGIAGVFSDKRPVEEGFPKLRAYVIPSKSKPTLSISNFPKAGALSSTIAHELGHNLSLTHQAEGLQDNLMKGHVKLRLAPIQIAQARKQALKGPQLKFTKSIEPNKSSLPMETIPGEGAWVSPIPMGVKGEGALVRVTVWFDKQFLGDGGGYQRRAKEFSESKRRELRVQVVKSLKAQSEESHAAAREELDRLLKDNLISDLERHWIVNGFTCTIKHEDVALLERVAGVRKIFLRPIRDIKATNPPKVEQVPKLVAPMRASLENLPWYIGQLKADLVWKEFGVAGEGILNVIHDKNFIFSDHLSRTVYRNSREIPGNGMDDDKNGYVDDVHGYNFDRQSAELYTLPFTGNPKDRKILHGTNCATIISGASAEGRPQFGLAPLSRWAGVINQGGIERSVEWAIEQGADTYSMSFSRRNYGEYQSHWRKVMEHGAFCGVYFVSGAGNRELGDPTPFLMNIPQNIPNAVFAAAGVQRDLSKTSFSCVGPVKWDTEHYKDGVVQKPEVCAFNYKIPSIFPSGRIVPDLLNGNSYAGPMFCGTISLMLSADPELLPWDLQDIITSTASDVGPEGVDYETGYGLINCYEAVKEVIRRKDLR